MGTKFGHFSVFDSNIKETVELLKFIPTNLLTVEKLEKLYKIYFPEAEYKPLTAEATLALKQSLRFGNVSQRTFFVGKNGNLITVFNDGWSLGIEKNVIPVSKNSSKTFLAVAVYDDDVLVLSIVKGGGGLNTTLFGRRGGVRYGRELGRHRSYC